MNDSRPDPFADLHIQGEELKRKYWQDLVTTGDPDAVAKHNRFCAELDAIEQHVRAIAAEGEELFELTRQAMMNVAIAEHQGDLEEARRVVTEFNQTVNERFPLQ